MSMTQHLPHAPALPEPKKCNGPKFYVPSISNVPVGNGFSLRFLKAHPWDSMTHCQFNFTGYCM